MKVDIEKLRYRMYHRRVGDNDLSDWCWERDPRTRAEFERRIHELIDQGFRVTTGYHCTSVRGFREYLIFRKPRKGT